MKRLVTFKHVLMDFTFSHLCINKMMWGLSYTLGALVETNGRERD